MAYEFKFPDVGEGITEGELVKWRVKEGDVVKEDDILAEVETDKAVVEIPSPKAGTILKLYHKEGDTVKVGETLVTIGEGGETAAKPAEKEKPTSGEKADEKNDREEKKAVSVVGQLEEAEEEIPAPKKLSENEVETLPPVRRLARDLGIDLSSIIGTGKNGRITEEDVRNAAARGKSQKSEARPAKVSKKYDMYGHIQREPLRGVRKATAKHMIQSLYTATHVTTMDDVDVTELALFREREKKSAKEEGVHLTFLPFIIKAVISALKKHPYLNASLDDEHEEIILKKYYNIGIAVDVDDGLLVPVVKNADKKSIIDIARELGELSQKARERRIDLADMKGGTFTITNFGSIGGRYATPIINYPEVAILGTGRIRDEPVVRKGKVVIRKMLPLSLVFDHRVLDGAEASRFLEDVKKNLEDPALLLMED